MLPSTPTSMTPQDGSSAPGSPRTRAPQGMSPLSVQDRLTGEMRLLGIKDIDGANKVLPKLIAKHNKKFAVLPAEQETAYVKSVERLDVDFLFARRQTRKTDGGGSFSYRGRTYAPTTPEKGSMARASVEVRETLSGRIWAVCKDRRIEMKTC